MKRLILLLLCAAAPAGTDQNSPAAQWYRELRSPAGLNCCSAADCRQTHVTLWDDGRVAVYIGREIFGRSAPDRWIAVDPAIITHNPRPPGVRGAIACWWASQVRCLDLEGGV